MIGIAAGIALLVGTALLFWWCLPRGDKPHFFIGTALEPYVTIACCVGLMMGIILIASAFI